MNLLFRPKLRRYSQVLLANQALRNGSTRLAHKPFYVFLEITNRCNIECMHCGRTHDPRYQEKSHVGDLPIELIRKLKAIIPFATYVIPTGVGEPFLNRDLLPTIRFLKACKAGVSITSNGTILNERIGRQVVESGLDKIVFSLDGARPETFNAIRVGADFDRVIRNIKTLVAVRDAAGSKTPHIEIEMIAMAGNFFDLPLLPRLAAELTAGTLIVETLFDHGGERYNQVLGAQSLKNIDLETGRRVWSEFLTAIREQGLKLTSSLEKRDFRGVFGVAGSQDSGDNEAQLKAPHYQAAAGPLVQITDGARPFEKVFCTQPWSIIYLTWKGEVRTCCFNETAIGDLNTAAIEQIWNSPAYEQFRQTILDNRVPNGCHDCLQGGFNYNIVPSIRLGLRRRVDWRNRDLVTATEAIE